MRFHALATDYDGTIAHHGKVDEATIAALERARRSPAASSSSSPVANCPTCLTVSTASTCSTSR